VFSLQSLDRPAELAVVGVDGQGYQALSHVNDALMAGLTLGPVKDVTFTGAGGDEGQMFVVYPPAFDAKSRYPLVQVVHGGPVGTSGDNFSFRWNPHAFAAPGYIVALVNFHGSASFGQAWVES